VVLATDVALPTGDNTVGRAKITDGTDVAAVTAAGELSVNCGNCTGSGASAIDDTAFTATSDDVAPAGFLYDTTPPSVTNGNVGLGRMNVDRVQLVDGSGYTQPVSGTVTTSPPANASTNVTQFGGTNLSTGTGAGGAGIPRVTLSNDSSLAANQSVNVSQMNGVAVTMGNGASGTGVQRVTLASDSTGQVAVASFPDNEPFNMAQVAGTAASVNNGTAGAGVQRVAIASDNSNAPGIGGSSFGSAFPSAGRAMGGQGTGNLVGYLNCDNTATYDASTNGSTQLVALTASQVIYVCGYQISSSSSSAVSVNLRYGTGTNCATSPQNITPAYPLQAATSTGPIGLVVMTPGFTGLKTAASNALCINTNAAVSVQAIVWYTKF
jgi:hypothetical protein